MKQINTTPLSGTIEFLPIRQQQFDGLCSDLRAIFQYSGYQHIETPILNRTETLLAKSGGETAQQVYHVYKTDEDTTTPRQSLRFDHTVPLARYVVEHESELAFPFKVYQLARNFRGERAQRGRLREFYQCDVDVVGRQQLDLTYDTDVIFTLSQALASLIQLPFTIHLSNRKLLTGFLQELNLDQHLDEILHIIDHAPKVKPAVTAAALTALQLGSENIVKITTLIGIKGDYQTALQQLRQYQLENQIFQQGLSELETVAHQLSVLFSSAAHHKQVTLQVDLAIVRGLDYYTGTVFETTLDTATDIAVCSGGRYEQLASCYTDQNLPGVGGSIGLSRLLALVSPQDLRLTPPSHAVDLAITPISDAEFLPAIQLAQTLRAQGLTVDVIFAGRKLGQRLTHATKIAPAALVLGADEVAQQKYQVKLFASGDQISLSDFLTQKHAAN